jgi:hypothetical protein
MAIFSTFMSYVIKNCFIHRVVSNKFYFICDKSQSFLLFVRLSVIFLCRSFADMKARRYLLHLPLQQAECLHSKVRASLYSGEGAQDIYFV